MDKKHSKESDNCIVTDVTSSDMSQNPRISSHPCETSKKPSDPNVSQDSVHRDKRHRATIRLCKSQSSQAALMPQEHKIFMEEAYNEAVCFKMLRELNNSDPLRLKFIIKKINNMSHLYPSLVLKTTHDYFEDNPEIPTKHKFRLFHVLETAIRASNSLQEIWEKSFMQLALDNMTKSTELEEAYQDAASNVLVAICRHSWQVVAQQLEIKLLGGVFPHRSFIYVMGVLTSNEKILNKEAKKCWEEKVAQMVCKSTHFLNEKEWSKELLCMLTKPNRTHQEQSPEKAFLFIFYGLMLQAEKSSTTVRTHLKTLLETSHQWARQREGIALTMGLAAACHLDHVWAVLDQFGRSKPIKWSLHSYSPKIPGDVRWKWASSTILLAYGQMAAKAKTRILPWVDNILSRMIFYFHYSSWDETLKQSFLTAVLMLVGAISRNEGAHSYEFSQIPELLDCLIVLMEKEPQDTLCSSARQQVIQIISKLCNLRPPLDLERKSRLLSTCLRSVLALPLLSALEKHTCLFLEPPNIQALYQMTSDALDQMLQSFIVQNPTAKELHFLLSHLYIWLASEKAHERQRAVLSCVALLKFLSQNLYLDPKEDFTRIGQLVGMLGILCQDPDRTTRSSSLEGVGYLYQLLMRQRGNALKAEVQAPKQPPQKSIDPLWSSGDQKAELPTPQEAASQKDHHVSQLHGSQVIKEIMKHLTMAELTDLIWITIDGLGSSSPFRVQAASEMLLAIIQAHGASLKRVADLGRAIHVQLCSVRIPQAKEKALCAITLLAQSHTSELVTAFLDFSIPLDSHAVQSWKALGAEQSVSRRVLAMLLDHLQERPLTTLEGYDTSAYPKEKAYLHSIAAMNTLQELQFTREFKKAVQGAFPKLFLALLTQMHYILELNLPKEMQPCRGPTAYSPQNTALETLKSLLSSTGLWKVLAHLELRDTWKLLLALHTYPQGVGLVARAMVQNPCKQIKAVLVQLLPSLQSKEQRQRQAAMVILTEFLYSSTLSEVISIQEALTLLTRSLQDPSPEVRVWSLQGLGNILFNPEKGKLLRGQLPAFLSGFSQSSESVVVQIMSTVSEVLHRLGRQGAGAQSLGVAIHARSFFDDERDAIRAAAMALFGDLVTETSVTDISGLQAQVYQSMVPLLLHLKDSCPAVATAKFAFYRCALLLRWHPQHTLFCSLAWEQGLSARHFLWTHLMTRSQEEFNFHLAQALSCLHSRRQHIKTWAALFIGYTICYHPQATLRLVSEVDTNLLFCTFQELQTDPDPSIRAFATRLLSFLRKVADTRQQ
ncbi:maestro heat-like repeat family member 5 isoform X2 [Erinaceus europaeus]|uniref:Maestro heat-like repeat family member 5 isoform X2 n=1 Tax=Erinaceus europaeus TaxID=9365 RepID=A0ABM3XSV0_ERIEU|nr:maestro heat-like repeat family member 5 isoform X2 [Erinaceus europaeus]